MAQKLKPLFVNLDGELLRQFKIKLATDEKKLNEALTELIKNYIRVNGKETTKGPGENKLDHKPAN